MPLFRSRHQVLGRIAEKGRQVVIAARGNAIGFVFDRAGLITSHRHFGATIRFRAFRFLPWRIKPVEPRIAGLGGQWRAKGDWLRSAPRCLPSVCCNLQSTRED
jgi:hypothetical protein